VVPALKLLQNGICSVKSRNIRYNAWHQRLKPQHFRNKSATGLQQHAERFGAKAEAMVRKAVSAFRVRVL
jgi:hypothetical protein